jgi:hypothetical protein
MTGDPFMIRCRECRTGITDWPDGKPEPDYCNDTCEQRAAERRIGRRLVLLTLLERARIVRTRLRTRLRRRT